MDDSKFHNEPGQRPPKVEPIVGGQKPKRNEPCPCGSDLKFKKCHGDPVKHTTAMQVAKDAYTKEMTRLVAEAMSTDTGTVTK